MKDSATPATVSGVPAATTWPPRPPPSGPRSITQSAALNHVQIVLDDDQAAAVFDQPLEGRQQLGDIVEVQAGGGLVENEQRARAARQRQVRRQLHALRFAAGERGGRLAQPQVAQPHVVQHLQLVHQPRRGVEKRPWPRAR